MRIFTNSTANRSKVSLGCKNNGANERLVATHAEHPSKRPLERARNPYPDYRSRTPGAEAPEPPDIAGNRPTGTNISDL